MKQIFTYVITLCFVVMAHSQDKIEISDFEVLDKTSWEGTLMYKDYSSGKKVILETKMQIEVHKNKITTLIQFPKEPKANSKNVIKIRKGGTFLGSEKIIKKEVLEDGSIKIITSYKGKDNYKEAKMFNIYLFSSSSFSIQKEVKYLDSTEKFIRNKQTYTRIKS
tara:strand:- start:4502 stop:4996 length:495 start_codon:yes stop_codon:yes gene_type:complete